MIRNLQKRSNLSSLKKKTLRDLKKTLLGNSLLRFHKLGYFVSKIEKFGIKNGKLLTFINKEGIINPVDPFNLQFVEHSDQIVNILKESKLDLETEELYHLLKRYKDLVTSEKHKKISNKEKNLIKDSLLQIRHNLEDTLEIDCYISTNFNEMRLEAEQDKIFDQELENFIKEQNKSKLSLNEKFPKIGSISKLLSDFEVDDYKTWEILAQLVMKDRFKSNLEENVNAMEGFQKFVKILQKTQNRPKPQNLTSKKRRRKGIRGKTSQSCPEEALDKITEPNPDFVLTSKPTEEKINILYSKLERAVVRTIWEEHQDKYRRIILSLVAVKHKPSPNLKHKIQMHIMNNLAMEYTPQLMLETLYGLYQLDFGSELLFTKFQQIFSKGHLFKEGHWTLDAWNPSTEQICQLIEIYTDAGQKFPDMIVFEELKGFLITQIEKKSKKFSLPQLVLILTQAGRTFKFEPDQFEPVKTKMYKMIEENLNGYFSLEDFTYFLEKHALMHFDNQEIENMLAKLRIGLETNKVRSSASSWAQLLFLLNAYKVQAPQELAFLSNSAVKFASANFMRLKNEELIEISKMARNLLEKSGIEKLEYQTDLNKDFLEIESRLGLNKSNKL